MGSFEFAVVASLRAAQLARGCTPRVAESHTTAITAQLEVAEGKVKPIATTTHPSGHRHDA
jgi:DNA-directed RNA polymerase subunit K/omega